MIFNVIGKKKIIKHRFPMLIEKSQPSGQRIMSEIRLTSFPALTVYPQAEISLSGLHRKPMIDSIYLTGPE